MGAQALAMYGGAEIDMKRTRARVEEVLESCRLYMQIGYHPQHQASTTSRFQFTPPSRTNTITSSTESIAQKNVDEESRRRELVEGVWEAVERLTEQERKIITMRYLEEDDTFDYIVWSEMNLSERKYYRLKARAFFKLALVLDIAIYVQK